MSMTTSAFIDTYLGRPAHTHDYLDASPSVVSNGLQDIRAVSYRKIPCSLIGFRKHVSPSQFSIQLCPRELPAAWQACNPFHSALIRVHGTFNGFWISALYSLHGLQSLVPDAIVPIGNSVPVESIDLMGRCSVSWFAFHVEHLRPSVFLPGRFVAFSRRFASRDSGASASASCSRTFSAWSAPSLAKC